MIKLSLRKCFLLFMIVIIGMISGCGFNPFPKKTDRQNYPSYGGLPDMPGGYPSPSMNAPFQNNFPSETPFPVTAQPFPNTSMGQKNTRRRPQENPPVYPSQSHQTLPYSNNAYNNSNALYQQNAPHASSSPFMPTMPGNNAVPSRPSSPLSSNPYPPATQNRAIDDNSGGYNLPSAGLPQMYRNNNGYSSAPFYPAQLENSQEYLKSELGVDTLPQQNLHETMMKNAGSKPVENTMNAENEKKDITFPLEAYSPYQENSQENLSTFPKLEDIEKQSDITQFPDKKLLQQDMQELKYLRHQADQKRVLNRASEQQPIGDENISPSSGAASFPNASNAGTEQDDSNQPYYVPSYIRNFPGLKKRVPGGNQEIMNQRRGIPSQPVQKDKQSNIMPNTSPQYFNAAPQSPPTRNSTPSPKDSLLFKENNVIADTPPEIYSAPQN